MTPRNAFLSSLAAACLLSAGAGRLAAAGPATNAPPEPPKSVFTLPTTPKDGRDPFFPDSPRPYPVATRHSGARHSGAIPSLEIEGVLGTPGHRLVIINNVTFAEGDVQKVITPAGRVLVRCVAINGNTAVIEANGRRESLTFRAKP